MKILELFAGSRSFGKASDELGCKVFSIDIKDFKGINLVKDIEFINPSIDIPFVPDIIWASPLCTTYSIAAISKHRYQGGSPKTELAEKSDRLVNKTLWLINYYIDFNKDLKFYIENPRGYLRKMSFMQGIPRTTVTYCSYGDVRMKPTDIWSNNIFNIFNQNGWIPRPKCYNNNKKCHHEPAPRGSKTGTQGLKNNYERSKIPIELCLEILRQSF